MVGTLSGANTSACVASRAEGLEPPSRHETEKMSATSLVTFQNLMASKQPRPNQQGRVLPHRCLVLRRGAQNQLRPAIDPHGQFPLRLLGAKIGKEYTTADSSHLFRDFIEANAMVTITDNTVEVAFGKRAHSPLLLAAGFQNTEIAVPWWGGRKLKISFA